MDGSTVPLWTGVPWTHPSLPRLCMLESQPAVGQSESRRKHIEVNLIFRLNIVKEEEKKH
uniref:Uncharacterized protein n=1 Tax=Anguilla anguilla TaxID=7936 RepID=A0A0E9PKU0_ANGAN